MSNVESNLLVLNSNICNHFTECKQIKLLVLERNTRNDLTACKKKRTQTLFKILSTKRVDKS